MDILEIYRHIPFVLRQEAFPSRDFLYKEGYMSFGVADLE